jgi:hypothetical protein
LEHVAFVTHAANSEQQQLPAQVPQALVAMGEHWELTGPHPEPVVPVLPPGLVAPVMPPALVEPVAPPALVAGIVPPAPPTMGLVAVDAQTSDAQVRPSLQVPSSKHGQCSLPGGQSMSLLPQPEAIARAVPNANASGPLTNTLHCDRAFIASSPFN